MTEVALRARRGVTVPCGEGRGQAPQVYFSACGKPQSAAARVVLGLLKWRGRRLLHCQPSEQRVVKERAGVDKVNGR